MKSNIWLLNILLVFWSSAVQAELSLKPIHPAEAVEYTLKQRFSLESALAKMKAIETFLESFRNLTAAAKGKIPAKIMQRIGNTDWETQHLAFANLPPAIEGALRYQNLLLKKTLHQLAVMNFKAGKISAQENSRLRQEMDQAENEFQKFWDAMAIAD